MLPSEYHHTTTLQTLDEMIAHCTLPRLLCPSTSSHVSQGEATSTPRKLQQTSRSEGCRVGVGIFIAPKAPRIDCTGNSTGKVPLLVISQGTLTLKAKRERNNSRSLLQISPLPLFARLRWRYEVRFASLPRLIGTLTT